jgi:TrmH family RNA methyltransferase
LVAEAIEKPSNLGAIIRSADGAGADALIVCDPQVDIFNPDVVRASIGTFFTLPVLTATPRHAMQWCRGHGILTLAATPHAETLYTDMEMRGPVAIAVGNEQHGLSRELLNGADLCVKLPMYGQINSLNVAVAAALLLYEVVRQRNS